MIGPSPVSWMSERQVVGSWGELGKESIPGKKKEKICLVL